MKAKPRRNNRSVRRDGKKDIIFRQLSGILGSAGYVVRREQLKQGHGWRVASGSCCAGEERLIFVDRRLSQDDQIGFLVGKIGSLRIMPAKEELELLPEVLQTQIENLASVPADQAHTNS